MTLALVLLLAQDTELVRTQHAQTKAYWLRELARHQPGDHDLAQRIGLDRSLTKGHLIRRVVQEDASGRVEHWQIGLARAQVRIPQHPRRAILTREARADADAIICWPLLTERVADHELSTKFRGKDRRHILHRLAFPVGRTVTAIDVEQLMALTGELRKLTRQVELRGFGLAGYVASQLDRRLASAIFDRSFTLGAEAWHDPVDHMIFGGLAPRSIHQQDLSPEIVREPLAERNAHFEAIVADLRRRIAQAKPDGKNLAAFLGDRPEQPRLALGPSERQIRPGLYEVTIPVFENVEVYGVLLLPTGASAKTKRPAVIAQHGLGGQPLDLVDDGKVYHGFATKLAQEGFVVFGPYVTQPTPPAELINPLARLAAAQGRTRISLELAKLRQIVDYLHSRPEVDASNIGYYGLSYGGYSALWMTPLEPRIKAVIVSGHFNDWRRKITDETTATSYLFHPDEDFYHWNVLNRFTHVELVEALRPRPVMIEYGTRDPVTPRAWHDAAWQAIRRPGVERDVFDGVHEVHATATFDFLKRWLVAAPAP